MANFEISSFIKVRIVIQFPYEVNFNIIFLQYFSIHFYSKNSKGLSLENGWDFEFCVFGVLRVLSKMYKMPSFPV